MIEYSSGPGGYNLLLRWHGSALAKAFLPGLLAVIVYLALHYGYSYGSSAGAEYLYHPYAIGVLVSSVAFLIIFRANYAYQRYWEACSEVHKCMSKWMDFYANCAVFHLQSEHFKEMRPPTFFEHDDLNALRLTRNRERGGSASSARNASTATASTSFPFGDHMRPAVAAPGRDSPMGSAKGSEASTNPGVEDCARSVIMVSPGAQSRRRTLRRRRRGKSGNRTEGPGERGETTIEETPLVGPPRLDGGWGMIYPDEVTGRPTSTYYDVADGMGTEQIPDPRGYASTRGGRTPSLFLQELAHLSSLLCAVGLASLRNDAEEAEAPLCTYEPGQPWPVVDPGDLPREVKARAYEHGRLSRNLGYLLGMDQTQRARTIYNMARPLPVIGGVSDNEIAFLQRARGPYAKTQLVWTWLSDFMIREHHAGSMGAVAGPIISRIAQFLGDGMLAYNGAKKIMYTPFPFPHAQLSAFFVLMMVLAIPFLMEQYANEAWLGAVLSFLTVTCLAGLHEVARELENPFRNAPNDIPLCTMMAHYNEALVAMFAGFHPDAYWDKSDVLRKTDGEVSLNVGGEKSDGDDPPWLIPVVGKVNGEAALPMQQLTNNERPSSALPQSVDYIDSLKELRDMIDIQASKIEELEERMQRRGSGSRPQTVPSSDYMLYDTPP